MRTGIHTFVYAYESGILFQQRDIFQGRREDFFYRDATASKNKKIECAFLWALERDKEGRLVEG